jgi:thioredoxin 1
MIDKINTLKDFQYIINNNPNKLIIFDFMATWCKPCSNIAPLLDRLSHKYSDVLFFKIDVDDNTETAEYCNISCMPTFLFYKNNNKITILEGGSINDIEQTLLSLK